MKLLLQYCIENYEYNFEEYIKVPAINYLSKNNKIILEHNSTNINTPKKETEYYKELNNILNNISPNKSYKIEFDYDTELIIEHTSLINTIYITEQ